MKFREYFGPMLLKEMPKPFDDEDFLFELKFDGIRATVHAGRGFFRIFSRRGVDITNVYPELKKIQKLVTKDTIFDGEIVAFEDGIPSFSKLSSRNRLKDEKKIKYFSINEPVTYVVFDCLYEGKELVNLSLMKRKRILEKFPDTNEFVKTQYIMKDGKKLFEKVKDAGLEGIVAKRIDSTYEIETRSSDWIKIKNFQKGTFFIGGFVTNAQKVSLLLGEYRGNKFYYVGKVAITKRGDLYKKLMKTEKAKANPFVVCKERDANYIKPEYKCEVVFIERTESGSLRQPVFKKERR